MFIDKSLFAIVILTSDAKTLRFTSPSHLCVKNWFYLLYTKLCQTEFAQRICQLASRTVCHCGLFGTSFIVYLETITQIFIFDEKTLSNFVSSLSYTENYFVYVKVQFDLLEYLSQVPFRCG